MTVSATYLAIESMLYRGWITLSFAELERILIVLEYRGLISRVERKALLELAKQLNNHQLPELG